MHEIRRTLEDDRVGEFDAPRVTLRHDACRAGYCGRRPDESAKRDCRFATYWPKVSKPHCVGVVVACFHRRPMRRTRRFRLRVGTVEGEV
jgi:hypothetical protein